MSDVGPHFVEKLESTKTASSVRVEQLLDLWSCCIVRGSVAYISSDQK